MSDPTKDFTRITNMLVKGKPVCGYHRLAGGDAVPLRGVQYISIRSAISYNQAHSHLYQVPLEFDDHPAWTPKILSHFEGVQREQLDAWDKRDPPKEDSYKLYPIES